MPIDVTEELLHAPLRTLAEHLRTRRLSSLALTKACLGRLETIGPRLGAVVTVTRELALREARAADQEIRAGRYRGQLHGIPYGAKDLLATRGIPTTWGAKPYRNQVFDHDATVIRKLREAGAVLAAKLAMVELAGGFGYNRADASFTGPGRTPWNTAYWSGGSSSGPGAAVAAGLVPFAIGSETSGSIITPAAYSGVAGLRPTYGRVSRHGAMPLSWTLDKIGPMCRTADCCGLVLAAIAGRDPLDASSAARSFAWTGPGGGRFRIAVIRGATDRVQPEVRRNFEESLRVLGRFCTIAEPIAFPSLPYGEVMRMIIGPEAACAFRELIESGRIRELRTGKDKLGSYAALLLPAVDYLQAMRVRTSIQKALDRLYAPYDALVSPGRATVAYPIARRFDQAYPGLSDSPSIIPANNLAGQPAIAIVNGFGQNNLPTSLQLTGRAWSEGRLLSIAQLYQQATDWHTRRPPLA